MPVSPVISATLFFCVYVFSFSVFYYTDLIRHWNLYHFAPPPCLPTLVVVHWKTHYTDYSLWSNLPLLISLFSTGIVLFILSSLFLSIPPTCHLHAGGLITSTNSLPLLSLSTGVLITVSSSLTSLFLSLHVTLYLNVCLMTRTHTAQNRLFSVWHQEQKSYFFLPLSEVNIQYILIFRTGNSLLFYYSCTVCMNSVSFLYVIISLCTVYLHWCLETGVSKTKTKVLMSKTTRHKVLLEWELDSVWLPGGHLYLGGRC